MTNEEILDALSYLSQPFPEEAVRAAAENLPELTPKLLEALEWAADNPEACFDEDFMLHTYAMFLLGHAREKKAFPHLLRIARLPEEQLDELLGDVITEGLNKVLAATCPGDWTALKVLVEDPKANEFARDAGLNAMLCMVAEGDLEKEVLLDYCYELLNGGLEREDSFLWSGIYTVATKLGVGACKEPLYQAYEEGLIDPSFVSWKEFESDLEGKTTESFDAEDDHYPQDCVTEMGWWACFEPEPPLPKFRNRAPRPPVDFISPAGYRQPIRREGAKVGRNDPCPCGSGKKYKKCCGR